MPACEFQTNQRSGGERFNHSCAQLREKDIVSSNNLQKMKRKIVNTTQKWKTREKEITKDLERGNEGKKTKRPVTVAVRNCQELVRKIWMEKKVDGTEEISVAGMYRGMKIISVLRPQVHPIAFESRYKIEAAQYSSWHTELSRGVRSL